MESEDVLKQGLIDPEQAVKKVKCRLAIGGYQYRHGSREMAQENSKLNRYASLVGESEVARLKRDVELGGFENRK